MNTLSCYRHKTNRNVMALTPSDELSLPDSKSWELRFTQPIDLHAGIGPDLQRTIDAVERDGYRIIGSLT
jgi:hypothetical protein